VTPWQHADQLNAQLGRDDVKWVVQYGRPELIDCPEWSARNAKAQRARIEKEQQEALGRAVLPLDGGRYGE